MWHPLYAVAAVALLMIVNTASAEPVDSIKDLKAANWNLSFTAEDGFCLDYNGVNLIRSSTLVIHNGQYTSQYFNYTNKDNHITVQDIPGGKMVIIEHHSKTFTGTHKITLLPNKAAFQFGYGMPADISNGRMDYCFGYMSAQPFMGRHYSATGAKGEKSGIIPIIFQKADENFAPYLYKDITFDSTLGKLNIHVDGDLDGQELLDFRNGGIARARRTPILWSGIFGKPMEGGKRYSQTITITIEPAAPKELPMRASNGGAVEISNAKKVQEPADGDALIIPEPKEIKLLDNNFELNAATQIVVADGANERDFSGALQFASEVRSICNLDLKIVRESQVASEKNLILVGELTRNKALAKAAGANDLTPPAKDEGYGIKVTPDAVLVAGYDPAGSFYGMQTLRQLVRSEQGRSFIRGCQVTDWPTMKFRGVLLYTGKDALPFHKKLIDRIFTRFKYNYLVLECSNMQWKTNPELATEISESQDDVRQEIEYARRNFIEVIPEISTLGHAGWMFKNGQNRNIAEDVSILNNYCPSKKETYDFVFNIIDEICDLFKPVYIHIGHDEVANYNKFPTCPLCSGKSMTELFGEDIQKLHNYANKKGVRLIIWGDMLLAPGEASSQMNAPNSVESRKRRDMVPKDIIIADWHYSPARVKDYTSLKLFKDAGFNVIAAPWNDPINISGFAEAAKRDAIMGQLLTLWVGFNSNENDLKREKKQFIAMVLAGECAWNDGKTTFEELPYNTEEVFDQSYERKQPVLVTRDGFTTDIRSYYNVKLADQPSGSGWIGMGPDQDLSNAPTGLVRLKGIEFRMADSTSENSALRIASSMDLDASYPSKVDIRLNTRAKSLFFLHTAARFDETGKKAGAYMVSYSDGTQVEIPLIYGINITAWNDPKDCPKCKVAWAAKGKAYEKSVIRMMEWANPSPEKTITGITMLSNNTESGPALLAISGTE